MRSIPDMLAALAVDCRQATRLQSDALDRALPFTERFGLRLHLLFCKWCRRYGKQLKFLRAAARKAGCEEFPSQPQSLSPESRQRMKHMLETAGE